MTSNVVRRCCRCRSVIYLAIFLAWNTGRAQTSSLSESWDSFTNHATPYGDWQLDRGDWGDISDTGRNGSRCYYIGANVKSRVRHEIDLSQCNDIVLQGWLYDSGGGINRSALGLNDQIGPTGNALIRIGTGAPAEHNYTIIFVDHLQSGAPITVDTGLPLEKGWHFLRLDLGHDRTITYRVWNADQTIEKSGHFVWVFDKSKFKYAVVGAVMVTSNAVAWDDIKVGSLEQVGPPPQLTNAPPEPDKPKAEKPQSKDDGLRLWLRFEDELGSRDSSPNHLIVDLKNGASVTNVDGRRCVNFDGNGAHIELPGGFNDFSEGMTAAFWARPTTEAKWARFLDFGNGEKMDNIVIARDLTNANFALVIYQTGRSRPPRVVATNALELLKWQHLAVAMDASGHAKLYKNGVNVAEGDCLAPRLVHRASNFIAKSNFSNDEAYAGQIDDVRIYSRVLRDDEIDRLASLAESAPGSFTTSERKQK